MMMRVYAYFETYAGITSGETERKRSREGGLKPGLNGIEKASVSRTMQGKRQADAEMMWIGIESPLMVVVVIVAPIDRPCRPFGSLRRLFAPLPFANRVWRGVSSGPPYCPVPRLPILLRLHRDRCARRVCSTDRDTRRYRLNSPASQLR